VKAGDDARLATVMVLLIMGFCAKWWLLLLGSDIHQGRKMVFQVDARNSGMSMAVGYIDILGLDADPYVPETDIFRVRTHRNSLAKGLRLHWISLGSASLDSQLWRHL
jgi:hypothetical protein